MAKRPTISSTIMGRILHGNDQLLAEVGLSKKI